MLDYKLLLHGFRRRGRGLPGALVRDVLDALDEGAKGAVRLCLEGRSKAGGGAAPGWVSEAAAFEMVNLLTSESGLELRAPTLGDALPDRFDQHDLFRMADPSDSAFTLLSRSLGDALGGEADSDAYDEPLLTTFEGFRRVFRHGVEALEIRNGQPNVAPVVITPAGIQAVERLKRQTPRPRRIRIAGKVDAIRHSDRAFTLVLKSGEPIRGVLIEGEPEELAAHFGHVAVVSGLAHFRPSGTLLRVDAEHVAPGTDDDLAIWSSIPVPLDRQPDGRLARQPQGPRSGINAILGMWPGDETDEEIFRMLEEIS